MQVRLLFRVRKLAWATTKPTALLTVKSKDSAPEEGVLLTFDERNLAAYFLAP
jgi:hypothetical protein